MIQPNSYLAPPRITFDQGPAGKFSLVRIDHGPSPGNGSDPRPRRPDEALLDGAAAVFAAAWAWRSGAGISLENDGGQPGSLRSLKSADGLVNFMIAAAHRPLRQAAWVALRPAGGSPEQGAAERVAGVATAELFSEKVVIKSAFDRLFRPRTMSGKINVAVAHKEQGQGIGTALLHRSLEFFDPSQEIIVDVPAENTGLVAHMLNQAGFDFIAPTTINYEKRKRGAIRGIRVYASAAEKVAEKIAARHAWLNDGQFSFDPPGA